MIRIRTGASWRHDPALAAAARRGAPAREEAARAIVDALALEVDGVDITGGRAEGPLLPTLEGLLRAVARVVAGAPHATVPFRDGDLELVIRRRGASALLTVVALARPSRVLANDVEVELEALSAAALEAAADFCRELAGLGEPAPGGARQLQAAARDLRRTRRGPAPRPRAPVRHARSGEPPGHPACEVAVSDDEGVLLAYEGGRPDLGSLLAPGEVVLRASDGSRLVGVTGYPFLVLRDLVAACEGLLAAWRAREARHEVRLARAGHAPVLSLELDLAAGTARAGGAPAPERGSARPCHAVELVRAVSAAALDLCSLARSRNPAQAENALLVDLESAAAARLAEADEHRAGELVSSGPAPAGAPRPRAVPQAPLGAGRLRRLVFRRTLLADAGAPAAPGDGLASRGRLVVASGVEAVVAVDPAAGAVAWKAEGGPFVVALPSAAGGLVLVARGPDGAGGPSVLRALDWDTGAPRWSRPLPAERLPGAAVAVGRTLLALAVGGEVIGISAATGEVRWRFTPPGAGRVAVAALGSSVVVAAPTGLVYGVGTDGALRWRARAPGPVPASPTAIGDRVLVAAETAAGAVLLALDASGARRWEAPLDLTPAGPAEPWAGGLVLAGQVAGDPAVALLDAAGQACWTVAPALRGPVRATAAGPLLVVRDAAGALVALDRAGLVRWSRPAPAGHPAPRAAAPVRVRGTLLVPGDGIACLDPATGATLAVVPGVAPAHLVADGDLRLVSMDPDGVVAAFRLATHLGVVG